MRSVLHISRVEIKIPVGSYLLPPHHREVCNRDWQEHSAQDKAHADHQHQSLEPQKHVLPRLWRHAKSAHCPTKEFKILETDRLDEAQVMHTVDRLRQRIEKKPLLLQLEQLLLNLCKVGRGIIDTGLVPRYELGKVVERGEGVHGRGQDRSSSNTCLDSSGWEDHGGGVLSDDDGGKQASGT
jgi:hypothetical protein